MTLHHGTRQFAALLALLFTLGSSAAAAPLQVSLAADRTSVQLGQPVLVTIQVKGCDSTPEVRPPATADCTISPVGPGTMRPSLLAGVEPPRRGLPQYQNQAAGQHLVESLRGMSAKLAPEAMSPDVQKALNESGLLKDYQAGLSALADLHRNDYTFTFQVQPEKTGALVVPAFTVSAGGQTAATRPVAVTVEGPRPQDLVRIQMSLANAAPLVGEETQLYVDVLVPRTEIVLASKVYPFLPFKDLLLTLPSLDKVPQLELVRSLEQVAREQSVPAGQRGARINNLTTQVLLEREPPDQVLDPQWYRRRLTIPVRLRSGGAVQVPAARVSGELFVPSSGAKPATQSFVAASESLKFEVRDFRARKDRPADFCGAIGEFQLTTTASQTNLPVGTPFTLTVHLEGQGSLSAAKAPELAKRPEFTSHFRVRLEGERTISDRVREFSYALRPLNEDVSEVPAVQLSYFNTAKDQFVTIQSQPIALTVTPAAHVVDDPAEDAAAEAATAGAVAPTWYQAGLDLAARPELGQSLPWVAGGLAVLMLLLVARRVVRRRQSRRAALRARKQMAPILVQPRPAVIPAPAAIVVSRKKVALAAGSVEEVRQTMNDFLRARLAMPPGEVTPDDALDRLARAGVGGGLARECADLLEILVAASFASGLVQYTPAELAQSARYIMDALDRQLGKQSGRGLLRLVVGRAARATPAAMAPSR